MQNFNDFRHANICHFRSSKLYDCCPKPYVDITYTIHVRRKSLFYTLYLIIPALIITTMVLIGFYLPPESGERMQLGITVLLAMIVFLQFVYQNLPSTSDGAPLLGKFYIITMVLISLSLAATCLVLNYSYGHHGDGEMPMWVRLIILDWLGRFFGSRNSFGKRRRIMTSDDILKRNEWKTAARILDKFFIVFFALLITIVSLSMFFQAPHWLDYDDRAKYKNFSFWKLETGITNFQLGLNPWNSWKIVSSMKILEANHLT